MPAKRHIRHNQTEGDAPYAARPGRL